MSTLPHLPLPQKTERKNYHGRLAPRRKSAQTLQNLENRQSHKRNLESSIQHLETVWQTSLNQLSGTPLEISIDKNIIPIFLKIDINNFTPDQLRGFGIEIIAEEDDGMIIGASIDAFNKLKTKIDRFANLTDKGTAYLWEIDNGIGWKRNMVLSPELNEKIDYFSESEILDLDISIACNVHVSDKPLQREDESNEKYRIRFNRWEVKALKRDEIKDARLEQFERIISYYGNVCQSFDYNDSFGVRVKITAKGLNDILYNYPYVFEIIEHDYLEGVFEASGEDGTAQVEIIRPDDDAPKVCVIDSGIMEGHRLLAPAIDQNRSRCYVPNENSVADHVVGGGHGTRVAGAVLYPDGVYGTGNINLPFWIQNARILDRNNKLDDNLFLPKLMQQIVSDYLPTKVYNLSVASRGPSRTNHMSLWASAIDKLMWENDILFVIAVGNLSIAGSPGRPGIKDFIHNGHHYPEYLLTESYCRIANPAQSSFALSVGSVTIGEYEDEDRISFGRTWGNYPAPSPFSRTGLGLWGMIKPDVVEFGGDMVREKNRHPNIIEHFETSPQLIKSVDTSQAAIGRDRVGTSFAAPKVSHIVAALQKAFPAENSLFLRALIVQSARMPDYAFNNPNTNDLRYFGYGVPNISRALDNESKRVTLYANGIINAKHADIYSVKIPPQLNRPGADFKVLIEVTLSYKSSPRRTRKRTQSYLSTWLNWTSSKIGEPLTEFQQRVINISDDDVQDEMDNNTFTERYSEIPWRIRERSNWGEYRQVKRQDSTLQKDWAILEAHALPNEISLAVLGHKGWSVDLEEEIPYCLLVSFEILTKEVDIDIYHEIRIENEIPIEIQLTAN
jgi:hypothetical protein